MKATVLLIVICCNLFVTDVTETISGYLTFKLVDFGHPKNEAEVRTLTSYIDELEKKTAKTDEDKRLLEYYALLRKNALLGAPSILLTDEKNNVVRVFLTPEAYATIAGYDLAVLQAQKKKVRVTLTGLKKGERLYFSDKITEVIEVEGTTPWEK